MSMVNQTVFLSVAHLEYLPSQDPGKHTHLQTILLVIRESRKKKKTYKIQSVPYIINAFR